LLEDWQFLLCLLWSDVWKDELAPHPATRALVCSNCMTITACSLCGRIGDVVAWVGNTKICSLCVSMGFGGDKLTQLYRNCLYCQTNGCGHCNWLVDVEEHING
jgi:hypothetical protein